MILQIPFLNFFKISKREGHRRIVGYWVFDYGNEFLSLVIVWIRFVFFGMYVCGPFEKNGLGTPCEPVKLGLWNWSHMGLASGVFQCICFKFIGITAYVSGCKSSIIRFIVGVKYFKFLLNKYFKTFLLFSCSEIIQISFKVLQKIRIRVKMLRFLAYKTCTLCKYTLAVALVRAS